MEEEKPIMDFVERRQAHTKHTVCPLEIQAANGKVRCIWVWEIQVIGSAPTAAFSQAKHRNAEAPHIRNISVRILTSAIPYVNNEIRMQRVLFHLIRWQVIGE